jgi:hypothetical protein
MEMLTFSLSRERERERERNSQLIRLINAEEMEVFITLI